MDVFGIVYLGDDEVPPEDQLGTIRITDHYTNVGFDLYKVDSVDLFNPSIKFGDPIMFSGAPNTEFQEFDIEFNLFCGAYMGSIKEYELDEYDGNNVEVIEDTIYAVDGTSQIRVQFGLFSSATIANVVMTLLGNSADTNVHGFVFASNSRLDSSSCASILFWKNSDSKVPVKDHVIPLSKSSVGVPLNSEFSLAISLICDNQKYKTKVTVLVDKESFLYDKEFCDNKLRVSVTFKCRD